eukprot:scaffold100856_cov21-Phaeocystis_antarctica.AAC.1
MSTTPRWILSLSSGIEHTLVLALSGLERIVPRRALRRGYKSMRGRTCQHSPPSRSHSAHRALCDRE